MAENLLEVNGIETIFKTPDGIIYAVNGVSFSLADGEIVGVVGESGCGKSVTMQSILRLIDSPPGKTVAGTAFFNGRDLLQMSEEEIRRVRGGQISMVFQDSMTALNPLLKIGRQISEALQTHLNMDKSKANERAVELLDMVGIPNARERINNYPHQFSGGMRQRAMIAMALACNPKILIADEPTTALDVTIQAQIVELVSQLRDELGMAVIWITHDLGIIANLAERVLVMYGGFIIEAAEVKELYKNPSHPYTIGLLGSLPRMDEDEPSRLASIDGLPPILNQKPAFCPFAYRCQFVVDRCWKENPVLQPIGSQHRVACWIDPQTRSERI